MKVESCQVSGQSLPSTCIGFGLMLVVISEAGAGLGAIPNPFSICEAEVDFHHKD